MTGKVGDGGISIHCRNDLRRQINKLTEFHKFVRVIHERNSSYRRWVVQCNLSKNKKIIHCIVWISNSCCHSFSLCFYFLLQCQVWPQLKDLHLLCKPMIPTQKTLPWPFYICMRVIFLRNWGADGGKFHMGAQQKSKQVWSNLESG